MNRDELRDKFLNKKENYRIFLEERNMKMINQFYSKEYHFPTSEEMLSLNITPYVWKFGDKFYKLAAEHYGDPTLWYIIAFFNKKPTDVHVKQGDVINIPSPFDKMIKIMENR